VVAQASPIPTGGFATLHTFAGGRDAEEPCGGPLLDPAGNIFVSLYFATRAPNQGAVFELKPSAGRYSDSIARAIDPEAGRPCSSPFENAKGELFLTTIAGGQTTGHGAVVKLVPTPNGYRESARSQLGYRARTHPGVLRPSGVGSLFGPAVERGSTLYLSAGPGGAYGAGAILALHEDDLSYASVYDFRGTVRLPQRSSDGFWPMPGLLADSTGTLYGATLRGGSQSVGTVFEVVPGRGVGRERVLWTFHHFDGALPAGGLVRAANGALYGTTLGGGKYDKGVVFELTPGKAAIASASSTNSAVRRTAHILRRALPYCTACSTERRNSAAVRRTARSRRSTTSPLGRAAAERSFACRPRAAITRCCIASTAPTAPIPPRASSPTATHSTASR
jgi:uncharacterized repeat protein (TIGR03803 family)